MSFTNIKKVLLALIILAVSNLVVSINSIEILNTNEITENTGLRLTVFSKVLSEQRELLIHLPKGYESNEKNYPIIYLLDGNGHFKHASTAVAYLSSQNYIPDAIVVGITNQAGQRGRDLSRESQKFWQYIKSEVIPLVEKNYRASQHKTIFAHSMAGAFVLREFLDDHSWFNGYIIASPGIDLDLANEYEAYFIQDKQTLDTLNGQTLSFSMADIAAEGKARIEGVNKLKAVLSQYAPKNFHWNYQFLPQHVHMTTPYTTFYEGIG